MTFLDYLINKKNQRNKDNENGKRKLDGFVEEIFFGNNYILLEQR